MNNRLPLTLGAILVLALAVWGFSWLSQQKEEGSADSVITQASLGPRVEFKSLTPQEARKKGRLEAARRELKRVKEIGEKVGDLYRVEDTSGDDLYVYPELIKGVGRFGEPMYLMAKVKRLPSVPLVKPFKVPKKAAPKVKRLDKPVLRFGKSKKKDKDG